MTARARTLWTFAITSVALFMVSLDNLVVTTAIPVIRTDLGRLARGPRVDGQRLHAHVRRLPPDRCRARRPLRAAAHVRARARRLHAGLGRGGARADRRRAEPRPRGAGSRRRDRDAADADAPQRGGPGREARPRARCVGRDRRPRDRLRPGRRRRRRRGDLVAVDLLAQRPHRPRPRPARAAAARGEPRPRRAARPPGRRARERRALRDRLGPRARERPGLGEPGDRRLARPRRAPRRRVRPLGAPDGEPDAADAVLPLARVLARERRLALHVLRDVRLDLPARAVLPDRAGVLAARRRAADPPVDARADVHRADRRRALRPDQPPADHRDGPRAAVGGARLDRARLDARRAVLVAGRAVRRRRDRDGALLRTGGERRPLGRPAAGGGAGVGCEQLDPRARRRARRGRARRDLRAGRRVRERGDVLRRDERPRCSSAPRSSVSVRSQRLPSPVASEPRRRRLRSRSPKPPEQAQTQSRVGIPGRPSTQLCAITATPRSPVQSDWRPVP